MGFICNQETKAAVSLQTQNTKTPPSFPSKPNFLEGKREKSKRFQGGPKKHSTIKKL